MRRSGVSALARYGGGWFSGIANDLFSALQVHETTTDGVITRGPYLPHAASASFWGVPDVLQLQVCRGSRTAATTLRAVMSTSL